LRLRDTREGMLRHFDVVALLLGLRLGESDRSDFGDAVRRVRHAALEVDRYRIAAGDALGRRKALTERDVGELWRARRRVADRVHVLGGAVLTVDDDEAAIRLHAPPVEVEAVGSGPATDGDEHLLDLEVLSLLPGVDGELHTRVRLVDVLDFRARVHGDPALF